MNTQRLSGVQSTMMKKDPSLNPDQHTHEAKSNPLRDAGPDLGLLKLASPDLERLIIQSSGLVAAGNPNLQFGYPKSASEEQEFAEGFVKALEDLHKQNQLSASADRMDLLGSAGLQPSDLPVYTTLNGYGEAPPGPASVSPFPPPGPLKDEPQTVPDVQTFGDSPPLSPIDMDSQERIKAERKKLRNRIAASKCRKRKLERISRLEEKVRSLKNQNSELESTASGLRDQVARLKQKVLSHVSSGCQLMPNQVQVY